MDKNQKMIAILAGMAIFGAVLVVSNLPHQSEVQAQGGVEVMITPHTGCQSIVIDGVRQLRCEDGLSMEGALDPTQPPPTPIP